MSKFVLTPEGREHVARRIAERFHKAKGPKTGSETPSDEYLAAVEEGGKLATRALEALEAQTPDDWRFTRHASASFFVSIVQQCPIPRSDATTTEHVKLLGVTSRSSRHTSELDRLLAEQTASMVAGGARPDSATAQESLSRLERMAELYILDLECPESTISHEFRTAFAGDTPLAQRRDTKERVLADYTHTLVLRATKTAGVNSTMANALLCPDEDKPGGFALWARQGDRWSAVSTGAKNSALYAMFCPLNSEGIDTDTGCIWEFRSNGSIARKSDAQPNAVLGAGWPGKPEGYHSESYWTLPTRLDVLSIDYDYLHREQAHRMSLEEVARRSVIGWVYDLALHKAGLGPEPMWFHKSGKG